MNNIFLLLFVLPAIFLFCINIYIKNVKEGMPDGYAMKISWVHGLSATFFFVFGYALRLITDGASF